jgi:hypothetical protein
MNLNLKSDKKSNQKIELDTLKTEKNHKLNLEEGKSVKFSLGFEESLYDKSNQYFKINDTIGMSTADFSFIFNDFKFIELHGNLRENKKLIVPEELNLYNSTSNTQDLISLMDFTIAELNHNHSWYYGEKDFDIFHILMKNKITREICYSSIKENYELFNSQITVFQKKMFLFEIVDLIDFCTNYNLNRKKYLKGKSSISEKQVEDMWDDYGYETYNEGFLFRRIEFDGVPPIELAQFLREFQKIIYNSLNSSDYNSNMSFEFNGGELKINSYANSKNILGFLLRTSNNNGSYFIPSESIKITKLEIKGKDFWRILYDQGRAFITLDENLKKV